MIEQQVLVSILADDEKTLDQWLQSVLGPAKGLTVRVTEGKRRKLYKR